MNMGGISGNICNKCEQHFVLIYCWHSDYIQAPWLLYNQNNCHVFWKSNKNLNKAAFKPPNQNEPKPNQNKWLNTFCEMRSKFVRFLNILNTKKNPPVLFVDDFKQRSTTLIVTLSIKLVATLDKDGFKIIHQKTIVNLAEIRFYFRLLQKCSTNWPFFSTKW